MLNVVIINGGRGASTLISKLLEQNGVHVSSIVNAYDDGKSTGKIRDLFDMLGPSDIRKVQGLMLPKSDPDFEVNQRLFLYRYPKNCARSQSLKELNEFASKKTEILAGVRFSNKKVEYALRQFIKEFLCGLESEEKMRGVRFNFKDCSIMNCLYAGAFMIFDRNIEKASNYIERLFRLLGRVLPTSIENKVLVAQLENGNILYSEAEIVEMRSNVRIDRVYILEKYLNKERFEKLSIEEKRYYLERHNCFISVSEKVRLSLQQADIIIYAPGTQHSSLYPTYMSSGLAQSIADNQSTLKFFITNIGADYETPTYKASDYVKGAYRYLRMSDHRRYAMEDLFDYIFINKYHNRSNRDYVEFDEQSFKNIPIDLIVDNFESCEKSGKHDGGKLTEKIMLLYEENSKISKTIRR